MEKDPSVDRVKLNENCGMNYSQTLKQKKLDPWNNKERQKSRLAASVYASTERINPTIALVDHKICENNLDYIGIKAKVDSNLDNNKKN